MGIIVYLDKFHITVVIGNVPLIQVVVIFLLHWKAYCLCTYTVHHEILYLVIVYHYILLYMLLRKYHFCYSLLDFKTVHFVVPACICVRFILIFYIEVWPLLQFSLMLNQMRDQDLIRGLKFINVLYIVILLKMRICFPLGTFYHRNHCLMLPSFIVTNIFLILPVTPEKTIPDIRSHRTCHSLFTMKKDIDKLRNELIEYSKKQSLEEHDPPKPSVRKSI